MVELNNMMAEIQEQQRQERELKESYDETWDFSGTEVSPSEAPVHEGTFAGTDISAGKRP